jgi:MA3 domain
MHDPADRLSRPTVQGRAALRRRPRRGASWCLGPGTRRSARCGAGAPARGCPSTRPAPPSATCSRCAWHTAASAGEWHSLRNSAATRTEHRGTHAACQHRWTSRMARLQVRWRCNIPRVHDVNLFSLQEYQDSHDVEEARRRLRELALPFVHHEAVKLALLAAMQAGADCLRPLRPQCCSRLVYGWGGCKAAVAVAVAHRDATS